MKYMKLCKNQTQIIQTLNKKTKDYYNKAIKAINLMNSCDLEQYQKQLDLITYHNVSKIKCIYQK